MNHGIRWTEWEDGIVVDVSISISKIKGINRDTLEDLVSELVEKLRAAEVCPIEIKEVDNDPFRACRCQVRPFSTGERNTNHRNMCAPLGARQRHLAQPLAEDNQKDYQQQT